jgi:phosphonate transport system substrate-binding protein
MNFRTRRQVSNTCLVAVLAVVMASPAGAQESGDSPLRFLKPWIERQLFGRETDEPGSTEDTAPTEPETAPSAAEPASPQTLETTTPPLEAPPPETTSETPPAPADTEGFRGSVPPDGTSAAEASAQPPATDLSAPAEAAAPAIAVEAKPEPLRFAVLGGRSVAATMAAVGPVASDLKALLGRPVEILPLTSYDAMIDAQVQRRIDGGFFSTAAYAIADARCTCLEPLAAPRASDGTVGYHAVIVARNGSGIASLADLAGKTIAIGAADSLGARRIQLAGLLSEGFDPAVNLGTTLEVESPEAAIGLVASGVADAAFAWSSLAGAADAGYSRGTLANLVASGQMSMDQLSIVWRSPVIGHSPFAVMRSLAEDDKAKIEAYLVSLSAANPTAYDMLDQLYGGGYAAVDAPNYSGLETLLAENVDALHLPAAPETTGTTALPNAAPGEPAADVSTPN